MQSKHYRQGGIAHSAGYALKSCPHPDSCVKARADWREGWGDAEHEETQPDPVCDLYQLMDVGSIYASDEHKRACAVLEGLQHQVSRGQPGCTVSGNRLTVRWTDDSGRLVDVHAVILSVST